MIIPISMLIVIVFGVVVVFRLIMDSVRGLGIDRFSGDAMVSLVEQENRVRPIEQSIKRLGGEIDRLCERVKTLERSFNESDRPGREA